MQCTHDCRRRRGHQQYDLVTAAYVLSELSSDAERRQTVQDLWDATKGILVLVEPGTPSGYQNVIAARGQVICTGGVTAHQIPNFLLWPCNFCGNGPHF